MKKMSIGFLAIILALVSVAFTKATTKEVRDCSGNFIWYAVLSGNGDDFSGLSQGNQIGSTFRALLDLNDYPDVNPLSQVTLADFSGHQKPETGTGGAFAFFSCSEGSNVCAIGFVVNPDDPSADFEIDVNGNIIPQTDAEVGCIIYRATP